MPLTFGTAEELARRDEVDLVVVTVKVPHHRKVVTTALQAGKMVLCEWREWVGLFLAGWHRILAGAGICGLARLAGTAACSRVFTLRSVPPRRISR